jgi:hypothetical protein
VNNRLVRFHLREAQEALQRAVEDMPTDAEYGEGDLFPAMQHIYHHLNTAWNARDASEAEAEPGTDEQFDRWGAFPQDFPLLRVG